MNTKQFTTLLEVSKPSMKKIFELMFASKLGLDHCKSKKHVLYHCQILPYIRSNKFIIKFSLKFMLHLNIFTVPSEAFETFSTDSGL